VHRPSDQLDHIRWTSLYLDAALIRKLSPKTQQGYIRTIKDFAVFLGRSPDTASFACCHGRK
jgi:hypothetical protein